MTYIYYKSSSYTTEPKISEKQISEWKHLAEKKNWRITQLANGYYQTEVSNPNNTEENEKWVDITRRETMEGAEAAIEGSVDHFSKKLEFIKGPKVVKTFK
tara:strand:- start:3344 stop:3646 length:303 start_codon:yes stop_codon:yes gene_type:complete